MSEEGKGDVSAKSGEAAEKHPESVPWSQYVGTKESLGNKLQAAEEKAKDLEEKLKNAPPKEVHDKLIKERDDALAELKSLKDEKVKASEKTAAELRDSLKGQGISEEQLKDMSVAEMQRLNSVLGSKPKSLPDMTGSGGGSGELKGSPMELATRAYASSNKPKK